MLLVSMCQGNLKLFNWLQRAVSQLQISCSWSTQTDLDCRDQTQPTDTQRSSPQPNCYITHNTLEVL